MRGLWSTRAQLAMQGRVETDGDGQRQSLVWPPSICSPQDTHLVKHSIYDTHATLQPTDTLEPGLRLPQATGLQRRRGGQGLKGGARKARGREPRALEVG